MAAIRRGIKVEIHYGEKGLIEVNASDFTHFEQFLHAVEEALKFTQKE